MKPLPTGIPPIIILAGASGDPGLRIVRYLLQRAASVRALVRKGSKSSAAIEILQNLGFFFPFIKSGLSVSKSILWI